MELPVVNHKDYEAQLNDDNKFPIKKFGELARVLIKNKIVVGGMIPKIKTCIDAVLGGAEASVIMDGRMPHSLLLELFTEHGVGTIIRKSSN